MTLTRKNCAGDL